MAIHKNSSLVETAINFGRNDDSATDCIQLIKLLSKIDLKSVSVEHTSLNQVVIKVHDG